MAEPAEPAADTISVALAERIRAGLLRIHSKYVEGANVTGCLREAYDLYAGEVAKGGGPLTDSLLTECVPAWVFRAAVEQKWRIGYPPIRQVRTVTRSKFMGGAGNLLEGRYNPALVPESELTESFGGFKVTKGFGARFRRRLEGRIAHWQAEALTRVAAGRADLRTDEPEPPSTDGGTASELAGGDSERDGKPSPQFPNRAAWLKERLRERSWNKHDLSRQGGPAHKTVKKILDGVPVREDVLQKVADGLSKRNGRASVLDIPQD